MKTVLLILCGIYASLCCAQDLQNPAENFEQEEQKIIKTIKELYTAHMSDEFTTKSIDSITETHLTKSMTKKLRRIAYITGAHAIIRAQDYQKESLKTLRISHLDRNWYMVSYTYNHNENTTRVNIPVRVCKENGRYKINYITPEWNQSMYGDTLLIDHPVINPIDDSSPLSLLHTFYEAYVTEYCSMPEDLPYRLKELRQRFCTERAINQFEEAFEYAKQDGHPGFDLLIDSFDFDRLWIPSMTCKALNEDEYEFSYKRNDSSFSIRLNVIKQGNAYRINGIRASQLY